MDYVNIANLIVSCIAALTGIFSVIKSNKFKSACCKNCWVVEDEFQGKDGVSNSTTPIVK